MSKLNIAAIFPGQGSQFIGMGSEFYENFPEAREVFEIIDEALGQKLSALIFRGNLEELTLTRNTQPAIMAVSIAALAVLQKQLNIVFSDTVKVTAGHSLGEYSALAAAGVFSIENTAKLLRIRGDSMQEALIPGVGGMLALIGADFDSAQALCEACNHVGVCEIANDNGNGQIVLSGHIIAIDMAEQNYNQFNIKKAIRLNVSTPFHSSLMAPACSKMHEAINSVTINTPVIDVIANFDISNHSPDRTTELLTSQISGKVRWRESMEKMKNSYKIDTFLEIGPNKVLSGIAKRMYPESNIFNLEQPKDLEELAKLL